MNFSLSIFILFLIFDALLYHTFSKYNGPVEKNPLIKSKLNHNNGTSSELVIKQLKDSDKSEAVDNIVNYKWWVEEQNKRKLRIKEVCSRMKQRRLNLRSFLYDPKHRLFFCKNAKVSDCYKI